MRETDLKDERFEVRLSTADKRLLTRAAKAKGMKPSEFAVKVLRRAARKTIDRVEVLEFSRRAQVAMLEALLSPAEPNEKLRKAQKRYDDLFRER